MEIDMKKFKFLSFILILSMFLCIFLSTGAFALSDPEISSRAALVMDRNSGQVFYSKNSDQLVYPASTTKVMTVLLAIEAVENGTVSIYDEVTASQNMTYDLVADGSSAGIMVGETMTLENFLYCAMVSSANEACNVIAEYIGGTVSDFISMMNTKAKELGCTSTNFTNTHGLPDANHYTTAEDYALIVSEAVSHELFLNFCNVSTVEIPATNMSQARTLKNSNALICSESMYGGKYLYEYAAGIKTGFTSDAGYCLVSTAANNDIELIALVFGGQMYTAEDGTASYTNFEDSITLYDWVFNNFSYQEILGSVENVTSVAVAMGSDADSVNLRPDMSLTALLPNDTDIGQFNREIHIYSAESGEELVAPISAGEVLGEVSVSKDGVVYGTSKLVASSTIELSRIQFIKSEISKTLHSKPVKIIFAVLIVLILLYLFLVIRYNVLRARHKKAMRAKAQARSAQQSHQVAKAPDFPQVSYFTEDRPVTSSIPEKPKAPVYQAPKTPVQKEAPPMSESEKQAKAERDYFEEFFRQK